MKNYTEDKFKSLKLERQLQVILDLVEYIEGHWGGAEAKSKALLLLKSYIHWANFFDSESPFLSRVAPFEYKIDDNISLRQLLDIVVPIERYLGVSIKDDKLLEVHHFDKEVVGQNSKPLCLVLDHLRSAFNVGSILRTCECMGVEHIYFVGYTPTPEDKGVKKTSMGVEKFLSWSQHNHLSDVLPLLREKGYKLVALETVKEGVSLFEFKANTSMAVFVGNERFGLDPRTLKEMDECVYIPMQGAKNSLNVANTVGIVSFEILRQWSSHS